MKKSSIFLGRRVLQAGICLWLLASCQKKEIEPFTAFEGAAMSAPYRIVIGKNLSPEEKKIAQIAIQRSFAEADAILNNANSNSEISKINQHLTIAPILLSQPLSEALSLCSQIVALSGGRFDPTVEPVKILWREALQQRKAPCNEALQKACAVLGWHHICLENGMIAKDDPAVQIDISSVAKGVCIDWMVERLSVLGYQDLFVEWAGLFRAMGRHPKGGDWTVEINPNLKNQGQPFSPIPLRNGAIATSGHYVQKDWTLSAESAPDQQVHYYSPIIDPLSAQPLEKTEYSIATATVIAPTAALADALATAAMIFSCRKESEAWAQEVVEFYPDVSFWILSYLPKQGPQK